MLETELEEMLERVADGAGYGDPDAPRCPVERRPKNSNTDCATTITNSKSPERLDGVAGDCRAA